MSVQLPHYTSLLNTTLLNVFQKNTLLLREMQNIVKFFFSVAPENSDLFTSVGAYWVWWGEPDLSGKLR